MTGKTIAKTLRLHAATCAVVRLPPEAAVPDWVSALESPSAANDPSARLIVSITRTTAELSIVCVENAVPDGVRAERGFRCFEVEGPLDFSEVGVLASIVKPLAAAGVSIFVLSTFDTDYVFVASRDCEGAVHVLAREGHEILRS